MGRIIDLTGQKFDRLIVLKYMYRKNGHTWWKCKCDCGNNINTTSGRLRSGETKSCGCYFKEHQYLKKYSEKEIKLHHIYNSMKARCYNKNNSSYKNYGKRGIKVCDEWRNNRDIFVEWAINNGYQENLTIDRIDVNGNYEPNNCKWSTKKEQNNNTRRNVYITYNNKTKTLAQWAEEIGITGSALRARLNKMSIEQALTTKKLRNKKCINV